MLASNMSPMCSPGNPADGALAASVFCSQVLLPQTTALVSRPDSNHFGLGEPRRATFLAASGNGLAATLFVHIAHVVSLSAGENMRRVAARGIVATMATFKAIWDRSSARGASDLVSVEMASAKAESPMPEMRLAAFPRPAFVGFFDVNPRPARAFNSAIFEAHSKIAKLFAATTAREKLFWRGHVA